MVGYIQIEHLFDMTSTISDLFRVDGWGMLDLHSSFINTVLKKVSVH